MQGHTDGGGLSVAGPTRLDGVDERAFEAAGDTEVAGNVRAGRVTLAGATSVGGDLLADRFEAAGRTHVGGDVAVDDLDAAGQLHVAGDLSADAIDLDGATRVEGRTAVDRLSADGAARLGDVDADSVDADGALAAGEVSADRVAVAGAVEADRIAADRVALTLGDADSAVGTVTGETVTVERESGSEGRLDVERVAGAVVDVGYTIAEVVEGGDVVVGPGSEVEVVRAVDPEVHDDATVGRVERPA